MACGQRGQQVGSEVMNLHRETWQNWKSKAWVRTQTRKVEASQGDERDSWKRTNGTLSSRFLYFIHLAEQEAQLLSSTVEMGRDNYESQQYEPTYVTPHKLHLKNMRMENICNIQYREVSQLKFLFLEQCIKCPS